MWLPTPVYERIPQFFFLLGLLFIANGLYLGFDFSIAFLYMAIGAMSSLYGLGIFIVRTISRSHPPTASEDQHVDLAKLNSASS